TFHCKQYQRRAVLLGQEINRVLYLLGAEPSWRSPLSRCTLRVLLRKELDRLLPHLLVARSPAVQHDAEQPSLAVCARLEAIKMPPGPQHRVLHQVFCDGSVASEAHGGP